MTPNADHGKDTFIQDIVDIDPHGDVILTVGPTRKKLRVSSSALSLASSVLRAMFNSSFLEGTITNGIRGISLPDDDAEAFTVLCNIAHLRAKSVDFSTFSLFERLSVLCDKYDATEAAMPWSTLYFLQHFRGYEDPLTPPSLKMLQVAFAYNNAITFAMVSKAVLGGSSRRKLLEIDGSSGGYEILPPGFVGNQTSLQSQSTFLTLNQEALIAYHESTMRNIHLRIEAAIEPYIKEVADYARNGLHPYQLKGKSKVTASGRSLFDQAPSNNDTNSRRNGGAGRVSFAGPIANSGNPQANTQPTGVTLFGNQTLVSVSHPAGPAVPPFGLGALASSGTMNAANNSHSTSVTPTSNPATAPPLATNTTSSYFGWPIPPASGTNLFANPTGNTTNPPSNPVISPANTTSQPSLFGTRDVNVTGGLFGNSGLFGETGTTGQSGIGVSNSAGGGLFGDKLPVCKGKERLGSWLLDLSNAGLWPLSAQIYTSSHRGLLRELRFMTDSNPAELHQGGLFGPRCECRTCSTNLSTLMRDLSKELEGNIKSLCLVCVRHGKFTKDEGNCGSENHKAEVNNLGQRYPETSFFVGTPRTHPNAWRVFDTP
ncbi:MAG: hypothetical protein Q9187_006864 [Circinaria calcarea]